MWNKHEFEFESDFKQSTVSQLAESLQPNSADDLAFQEASTDKLKSQSKPNLELNVDMKNVLVYDTKNYSG